MLWMAAESAGTQLSKQWAAVTLGAAVPPAILRAALAQMLPGKMRGTPGLPGKM